MELFIQYLGSEVESKQSENITPVVNTKKYNLYCFASFFNAIPSANVLYLLDSNFPFFYQFTMFMSLQIECENEVLTNKINDKVLINNSMV